MTDQTPVPPPPPPPAPPAPTVQFPTAAASAAPPPPPPSDAPVTPASGGGRRGGRAAIIGVVAAALVLGGGFGAYAIYDRLSGGGAQPDDVLPASTQVYVRVDLDPSAGQKVDLFRLLRKVPDLADEVGIKDEKDDIRKLVFSKILASECDDVNYEKDVEPWLGDRIGVGANIEDRSFLIAVQTTDEDASRAGFKQLFKCADEKYGIAYLDGYAIIGPKQAEVDKAVAATEKASLSDNKTFNADFDQLGNPGIASAWADLKAIAKVPEAKEAMGAEIDQLAKAGSVASALRTDGDAIEFAVLGGLTTKTDVKATSLGQLPADTVAALSIAGVGDQVSEGFDAFVKEFDQQFAGLSGGGLPGLSGGTSGTDGTDSADDIPSSSGLADSIATTDPTADPVPVPTIPTLPTIPRIPAPTATPDGLSDDPSDDPFADDPFSDDPFSGGGTGGFSIENFLDSIERETGFKLPDDLETLFGDRLTLAIGSKNLETLPKISGPDGFSALDIALALSSKKAPALDLVQRIAKLSGDAGIPLVTSPTDDGAVLATNKGAADAVADPEGSLGDEKAFKSVIPDGDSSYGGLYVNIGTILDKLLEAGPPKDVRSSIESASALSAVGVSVSQQDDDRSLLRMRVSFK